MEKYETTENDVKTLAASFKKAVARLKGLGLN